MDKIQLQGRVFLRFNIKTLTGLHIGGTFEGISIGGVDKTVIRDPIKGQPYIPGSSLRGKMRSLTEKHEGLAQNQTIGRDSRIHSCGADYEEEELKTKGRDDYLKCPVCQVYGVPGERPFATPTRLIVRDVFLTEDSAKELNELRTDLPYTEVKTEVSIDRVTSAANPRQMERVPAGSVFGPAELVYSVYSGTDCDAGEDIKRFRTVVDGLQLLSDDYLGGLGSRGSGQVALQNVEVYVRSRADYQTLQHLGHYDQLADLVAGLEDLMGKIETSIPKQ